MGITENELLNNAIQNEVELSKENEDFESKNTIDFQKIKLINLSSILFIVLPPFNILAPLILSYVFKQKNILSKQIISLQILWTILAPIFFMVGIFLKLGPPFTIVLLIIIVLSNVFLILRNLAEIDRNKKLRYNLNFNIV